MKKIIVRIVKIFAVILIAAVSIGETTGGHIPIAQHTHPDSICWGYAQGRAFGKQAGDPECDPEHTYLDHIYEGYFPYVSDPSLSEIKVGDIVVFGQVRSGLNGHAAWVSYVPTPLVIDNIKVDQVPNQDGSEEKNVLLSVVKQSQGNPVGYHHGGGSGGSTGDGVVLLHFDNSFEAGTIDVGKDRFGIWHNRPSGWSHNYFINSWLEIHAINQDYQAPGEVNYFRVFQVWEKDGADISSSNSHEFQVSTAGTYTATFRKRFDLSLQTANYIDGGGGATYKVSGAGVGSSWTGTMLEGDQTNVEAATPSPWLFQNWSNGSATNPYYPTDHTTLYARYKAHLGSSDANVTSPGGQRKLWSSDGAEYYDLVYASAGEIWWTKYQANGTVLVGEQRISSGVGNASSPSLVIAGYDFSPKRYCVWQQYNPSSGLYQIMFSRYTGTAWTTPVNIGWAQYSSNNPLPVVTVFNPFSTLDYRVEVVWNQTSTVLATTTSTNNGVSWAGQTTFTGAGLFRPSLSPVTHYTKYGLPAAGSGLATDDNSQIYYRQYWRFESGGGPNSIPTGIAGSSSIMNAGDWSTSVAIPGSYVSGSSTNSPSTSQTSSYVWIVWQTYPTDQSSTTMKMIARNLSTDSWTSSYSLSASGVMRNPQIATRGQDVATAFEIPGSGVRLWKRTYAGVITTTDYPSIGVLPQISGSTNPALGAPRFVVRSVSGTPYEIRYNSSWQVPSQLNRDYLAKKAEELADRPAEYFGRKVTVMDSVSGEFISISIESPTLVRSSGQKTMPVFEAINDTIVDWEGSPWKYLTADLPQLSDAEYLDLDIKVSSNIKRDRDVPQQATVGLFDQSLTSVTDLADVTAQENELSYSRKLRVNLSGLRDRSLKVIANTNNWINPERAVCDMEHMYRLSGGSGLQAVSEEDVVMIEPLPTELRLLQNYPNPFNPETVINFELTEPGTVRLEIYDILGRRVSVLVDGHRQAGFHSASWRIDDKSTGTFIYRITFAGISGETKTLSRKMIVAK